MRQIDDRLHELLAEHAHHFIEEDRDDNRNEGVEEQLDNGDLQRVLEGDPELLLAEELLEVVKTYPVNVSQLVAVERITNAQHRPVVDQQDENENRQEHHVETAIDVNPLAQ